MKLGVENKKSVWALGMLTLGLGYAFYDNVIDTGPSSSPATRTAPPPAAAALATPAVPAEVATDAAPSRGNRNRSGEFHPIVHAKRPEDRMDTANVDPTLHLDLLAKLQGVPAAGDGRNLFAIGAETANAWRARTQGRYTAPEDHRAAATAAAARGRASRAAAAHQL